MELGPDEVSAVQLAEETDDGDADSQDQALSHFNSLMTFLKSDKKIPNPQ